MNDKELLEFFGKRFPKGKWRSDTLPEEIVDYLENRFPDAESIRESYLRIKLKIYERPVCPICGRPALFCGLYERPYKKYCSQACAYKNAGNVLKAVMLKKYNVENISQLDEIKRKKEETCLKHYGAKYAMQNKEYMKQWQDKLEAEKGVRNVSQLQAVKDKANASYRKHYGKEENPEGYTELQARREETTIESLGVRNPSQSEDIKEKKRLTTQAHYHVDNPWQAEEVKEKIRATNIERTGYEFASQSPEARQRMSELVASEEMQKRRHDAMKANGTFRSSKTEEDCYKKILEICPDTVKQYHSEAYPYNCDFYIPSLDMYIEFQGGQYHQFHPFNPHDLDDMKRLEDFRRNWKRQYEAIINVWTISDPEKRKWAADHNLNFEEVWGPKDVPRLLEKLKALKTKE